MNLLKSLTNLFQKEPEKLATTAVVEDPQLQAILDEPVGYRVPKQPYHKMNEEQQLEFVKYIAKGYTPSQILDKMKDNHGITVNYGLCYEYRKSLKWRQKIKELKTYYRQHPETIPGANKSVRIARMEHVMDKANKKGDLRVVVSANEQIRKEFEKETGDINIYHNNPIYQQFNNLSNDELLKKQKEATAKLIQRRTNGPSGTAEE